MSTQRCLIIGASHAAAQLVPSLRQEGWRGEIVLVGEEPWLPYNRPPLSKTFLSGEKTPEELLIRPAAAYEKAEARYLTGRRAVTLDRDKKRVVLDDGEALSYDKLALTVGARARTLALPGADMEGVFRLRTLDDVEHIRPFVGTDRRAVIIGGGYIGLEAAAMLRQLGMAVTLLEAGDCVLGRVCIPQVADFFTRVHREEGVEVVTGAGVTGFEGTDRVEAVTTAGGRRYPADLVIIGVGVTPNTELAQAAGLAVDDGILVDEHCVTSDPDIVAAGDCTRHPSAHYGYRVRLESVQNAVDQAKVAAAAVCGVPKAYNALPWFWSDQYDLKLQIAGLSAGFDELVVRGDIRRGRKFAAFYLKERALIAVDAVNSPQEFMLGKRLISGRARPDRERLADPSIPMRELL